MTRAYADHALLIKDIVAQHRDLLSQQEHVLLSIDGLGGSGKTALAASLAGVTNATLISLDEYVNPHQGTYLPNLRYSEIERDLNGAELSDVPLVIIEGLCVLSALSRLQRQPDIAIYIRRIGDYGEWLDEFYYSEDNDIEEIFNALSDIEARKFDECR